MRRGYLSSNVRNSKMLKNEHGSDPDVSMIFLIATLE